MPMTSERKGEDLVFRFTGVMDENLAFPALAEQPPGRIVCDFDGVTMINSLACRNWVAWVKTLPPITLENCPPAVVNQACILVGFLPPSASVASFYVPYYCEPCGREERVLLKQGADYERGGKIDVKERVPCPGCSESMDLDVMLERYVKFLK